MRRVPNYRHPTFNRFIVFGAMLLEGCTDSNLNQSIGQQPSSSVRSVESTASRGDMLTHAPPPAAGQSVYSDEGRNSPVAEVCQVVGNAILDDGIAARNGVVYWELVNSSGALAEGNRGFSKIDSAGKFNLEIDKAGLVCIICDCDDLIQIAPMYVEVVSGKLHSIRVEMRRSGSILGSVVDVNGHPVAGCYVRGEMRSSRGDTAAWRLFFGRDRIWARTTLATADENGYFELRRVMGEAEYKLTAWTNNGVLATEEAKTSPSGVSWVELRVVRP